MYPAAKGNTFDVVLVSVLFGFSTIVTMVAIVMTMYLGVKQIKWSWLERYGTAVAGLIVVASGVAVVVGL